eukprot:TRINITY_DN36842_c0_g1_i2.p1 TRINITY_DN36842_c0_g1~~TRINITY_DN36842_c0_g1_i2.p1  ORF type:complete len:139 (+),score=41.82 TRINITY_DN36842_c0_g1_i2:62-478(+)
MFRYGICFKYICVFFFFKQKTAYEMLRSLVGSEMCIRDRYHVIRRAMDKGKQLSLFHFMRRMLLEQSSVSGESEIQCLLQQLEKHTDNDGEYVLLSDLNQLLQQYGLDKLSSAPFVRLDDDANDAKVRVEDLIKLYER